MIEKVIKKLDNLTKPKNSLGDLERLVVQIADIQNTEKPCIDKKAVVVMCADNGVVEEGVSPSPQKITYDVTNNFTRGITGINVFAKHAGAQVFVVDIGVAADFDNPDVINKKVMYGTKNIAKGPAMTRKQAQQAIDAGIEMAGQLAREGVQIIATGEMGVGNTTTSAAVAAAYFPDLLEQLVGRGAGVSDEGFLKKRQAVRKALLINQPDTADPLDVLSKVGGLDIAGICGLFLGGKKFGLPVVIDGFISAVGAFLAWKMDAGVRKFMIASHKSAEGGAAVLLNAMHQKAFLDLSMRLGEGTGAALMLAVLDFALAAYYEMGSFCDAAIDEAIYLGKGDN